MNENRMREPIDSWIEAANTVAQSLGQHRDDAVGQINAVAAPARLAVQRAAWLYVGGDIGDVHAETPAAVWKLVHVNCVIEIARVIGVDGDDELVAQIFASRDLLFASTVFRNPLRLLQNFLRKFRRQMVLADDRKHVHSGRRCRPEHLDDFALGIDVTRFPDVQANHDFVANCSGGL